MHMMTLTLLPLRMVPEFSVVGIERLTEGSVSLIGAHVSTGISVSGGADDILGVGVGIASAVDTSNPSGAGHESELICLQWSCMPCTKEASS